MYRVKFGEGKEDLRTSVIGQTTEVPLHSKVVFLANLVGTEIAGVVSEVSKQNCSFLPQI